MINPTRRPLPDNTQHSQHTDIYALGRIRTRNPSTQTAADPGDTARPPGSACFLLSMLSMFDPSVWHVIVCSNKKPQQFLSVHRVCSLAVRSVYQSTSCVDCVQQGTLVSCNRLDTKSKIQPVFPPTPQNNEDPFRGTDCDSLSPAFISDVILFSHGPPAVQSTNCGGLTLEESYLDSD